MDKDQVESSFEFAGVPDPFQRLWTPHRMAYVEGDAKPRTQDRADCPFCRAPKLSDEEGLIVYRGENAFVLMNLFPYNSGHLLICPYRHTSWYPDLTVQERDEISALTVQAMKVLKQVVNAQGFNLGMNQGEVAGAGIAAHLHQHVVPRYGGDANFLPIIAQTKAVPQLLEDARQLLAENWESVD
ncbi:MAG TPA: HIT domain-containing protein [Actinomyces sp.]|jgi:ATP adenylyltransferase|nr:HIT domain-containing protein [Acidobacteriota bacterium]HHT41403.1 HIT domain-containing protein [Actinomyces sp.]